MPAVCTTTTSMATRRTSSPIGTQASSRPLSQGSSHLLPQYLLPGSGEEERLRHIEEEPECEAANTHVHKLQCLARSQQSHQGMRIHVLGDDYEEEFGKYIPNAAFECWERKRNQLRGAEGGYGALSPLTPVRSASFARQNFEDTCRIPFKLHLHILDDFRKKVNELLVYNNLRVVTQGDPILMERTVGRVVAMFTAINPFGMQDPRRVECNMYLQEHRTWIPVAWSVMRISENVALAYAKNPGSVDCLMIYIKYEVWREEIRRYIAKAIKHAREEGPSAEVPIQSFYNRY
ncbi:hypothetical protein B0H13DRAFT_2357228 [Mycena leptocephala]|nr:hypothetical protein B0H13DRAFT_2357228 [Mycena leptocephala]